MTLDAWTKKELPELSGRKTVAAFEKLAGLLAEKNKVLNLTAITSPEEIIQKHLIDSLMGLKIITLKDGDSVLDMGTGGGFPGLPLAIARPNARFTLVDSVGKKAAAVQEFIEALGLNNARALCERAEALGQSPEHRERYALVTARAFAPLPVLLELCWPLVQVGGKLLAYKGPEAMQEIAQAANAMKALIIGSPRVHQGTLPGGEARTWLVFEKGTPTPAKYPRKTGLPSKRPL